MIKIQRSLTSIKKISIAAITIFALSNCTDENILPASVDSTPAPVTSTASAPTIGSLTISGVFTSYAEISDCSTCTYVVPEDMLIVDGKELGLAPGAVICLQSGAKYGDLTFENLEGTEENPITIGTCGQAQTTASDLIADY